MNRKRLAPRRVPRLAEVNGRFYWKPEARLRGHFRSLALGEARPAAEAEARRLNGEVTAFLARHDGAVPGKAPKRRPGALSMAELIARWKQSDDWRQLRDGSRAVYTDILRLVEREFGHEPAAQITPARVDEWIGRVQRGAPRAVAGYLGRAAQAWDFGRRKGWLAGDNPFRRHRPRRVGTGRRETRLTWDEVRAAVAAADAAGRPSMGSIILVAFLHVQRIGDVRRLTRAAIQGPRLIFSQSKGGRLDAAGKLHAGFRVDCPLHPVAAERLRRFPPPQGRDAPLFPSEETGRPWESHTLSQAFDRLVRPTLAKLSPALRAAQIRDMRRSGFVHAVEHGASVDHVTAMSGHSLQEGYAIVEHYLPRTATMADTAARAFGGLKL